MIGHYETGQHEPPLAVLRAIADATKTTLLRLLPIEISPADLLRLIADCDAQLLPMTDPRTGEPVPSISVGITINQDDD